MPGEDGAAAAEEEEVDKEEGCPAAAISRNACTKASLCTRCLHRAACLARAARTARLAPEYALSPTDTASEPVREWLLPCAELVPASEAALPMPPNTSPAWLAELPAALETVSTSCPKGTSAADLAGATVPVATPPV